MITAVFAPIQDVAHAIPLEVFVWIIAIALVPAGLLSLRGAR